jgi:hypothetical protein
MPRPSHRVLAVAFVTVIAALPARLAASAPHHEAGFSAAPGCGVERWAVKTLQDRPRLLRRQPTTVAHLVSLPRPAHLPATRLPFERHIFRVIAAVTLVRPEEDGDLHLVLKRGTKHLIAETPNAPACTGRATAYRKRQMASARRLVRLCPRARVTGVAFFDFLHGQTGVAPNGIELHPVLGFACLS